MTKLLVVIVSYRVTDLTIDCLRSIASEIDSIPGMKVGVCENGTGDDSAERLQKAITENKWDGWCSLTISKTNLGFTGGNNVLIRPALASANPPQYILLLNCDTVVRPNAFRTLVDFMDRDSKVGVASSAQEDLNGGTLHSAFRFPSPWSEFEGAVKVGLVSFLLHRWLVAPPIATAACECEWVSGATMLVRREVFDQIGVLDEGYFTYFEDVDFCLHARKAGWSVWYVPESRILHLVGQASGVTVKKPKRLPSYAFEARRRFFLKNYGPAATAMADLGRIMGLMLWRLRTLFGKPDFTPPHYLRDCVAHSVFVTGFAVKNVEIPTHNASERRQ